MWVSFVTQDIPLAKSSNLQLPSKRRFHPIDFTVSVSGMSVWTKRNELAGDSRTRSF